MCATRGIAMRVVLAIDPGGLEFAAGAGALFIKRTAHPLANFPQQGVTTRGFAFRATHGNTVRGDQHNLIVRHQTTGRLALPPEKRHTKMRAAGATAKTRITIGHDLEGSETGKGRHLVAILCSAKRL